MERITFKDLIIGEIKNSSGVFSGDNFHYGWKAVKKINEGLGSITGDKNKLCQNHHTVINDETKQD